MSPRIPLYVFGCGGHGKVVAEAARLAGAYDLQGFLDDDRGRWGSTCGDGDVLRGGREALTKLLRGAHLALGVGDNRVRASVAEAARAAGRPLATVVHPSAVVASGVHLGEGTYVGPQAVIHVDSSVGAGSIVNSGSVVEHDCRLGAWVHVSPRACLGGGARLGDGAHVGMGAVVLPLVSVGAWSTLGAGAVLLEDLPPAVTAVGVPARVHAAVGAR